MPKPIRSANLGAVKNVDSSISCITRTLTKRGKLLNVSYFDVPDEEYGVGFLRGTAIAHQLFKEMQNTRYRRLGLVLKDAMSQIDLPGKRGAVCGLKFTIFECLEFASTLLNLERIALKTVNQCKDMRDRAIAREEAEKAAFVKRMADARKAKRISIDVEEVHV